MKFGKILFTTLMALLLASGDLSTSQAQTTSAPDNLTITVDYELSFADMIAAGQYSWINSNITEKRFMVKGISKVERDVELVHYGHYISTEDAIADLAKRGLRHATTEELFAFGAKYPNFQREFPIVALGFSARVSSDRYVLCLGWDDAGRYLNLVWWGDDWLGYFRLLTVRLPA